MKISWIASRLRWFLGKDLYAKFSWLENWAAALAFYNLICQVPIFVVTITLAGIFLGDESAIAVRDALIRVLPINSKTNSDELLQSLHRVSDTGFMTVAFILAIWTSANFMNQMLKALHFVMGGTWNAWRGAWQRRVKSFLLLIIWITKMLINAVTLLSLPVLTGTLMQFGLSEKVVTTTFDLGYHVLLALVTYATFYLTYRLASTKPIPPVLLAQACLLATAGWITVRTLFLQILPHAWSIGFLAGTITSMLALLLLAYAIAWVVLLGACWIARNPAYAASPSRQRTFS